MTKKLWDLKIYLFSTNCTCANPSSWPV